MVAYSSFIRSVGLAFNSIFLVILLRKFFASFSLLIYLASIRAHFLDDEFDPPDELLFSRRNIYCNIYFSLSFKLLTVLDF